MVFPVPIGKGGPESHHSKFLHSIYPFPVAKVSSGSGFGNGSKHILHRQFVPLSGRSRLTSIEYPPASMFGLKILLPEDILATALLYAVASWPAIRAIRVDSTFVKLMELLLLGKRNCHPAELHFTSDVWKRTIPP